MDHRKRHIDWQKSSSLFLNFFFFFFLGGKKACGFPFVVKRIRTKLINGERRPENSEAQGPWPIGEHRMHQLNWTSGLYLCSIEGSLLWTVQWQSNMHKYVRPSPLIWAARVIYIFGGPMNQVVLSPAKLQLCVLFAW